MKVFRTTSMDVIAECRYWFGLLEMGTLDCQAQAKVYGQISLLLLLLLLFIIRIVHVVQKKKKNKQTKLLCTN